MPEAHHVDIRKNIQFGIHDGDVLMGDYYAPVGTGRYPALVALHGGGWKRGAAEGYQYWGPYLAEHGYVLFPSTIAYWLEPRTVIPRQFMIPALPCNFCGAKRQNSSWIPTGLAA